MVKVTLDPSLLQKYGVNISDIYQSFKTYNNIVPAGVLSDENANFSVKVPGLYQSYRDLKELPITSKNNFTLKLSDVAEVKRTYGKRKNMVVVNGNPALSMEVSRSGGTNIIETYDDVKKVLAENEGKFHPLVSTSIVDDESTEIKTRIESAENTVNTAVILVMIIVIAALGIRSGTLVGLSLIHI